MPIPLIEPVISLALPPRCPGCGIVTTADHRFCVTCWSALRFLAPPWCASCHAPFAYDRGADSRCADCIADPPRHAGLDAAVVYGDIARTVALRLKYGGRAAFAETAARLMLRHLSADADLIVPVPLHRHRLWSRGYNQAALVAGTLTRICGVPADLHALVRTRATPVLRDLGRRERARVLAGAFAVPASGRPRVAGKSVVLVDDVYTSGATANACARKLLAAGAGRVTVLCWARVLGEAHD